MVAVPPAVDGALDETTLSAKARVQLRQSPADGVAFSLVVKTVALVLILGAASARVYTVLGLEVLRQLVNIDRLDIAADGVLHLDPVARVLKRDPLHTILVLSHNKGSGGRNGTRRGIRVDVGSSGRASVHVGGADGRALRRSLRRAES